MAEIVADAAGVRAAAGGIVDAAGAVDVLVAVGGIGDAGDLAGEDTRSLPRIYTDQHGQKTRPRPASWPFLQLREEFS